jgi:hypothetical protein
MAISRSIFVRRRIVLQIFAKSAKPIVFPSAAPVFRPKRVRHFLQAVRSFSRRGEPVADVSKAMKTCALVAPDGIFFKVKNMMKPINVDVRAA